MKYNWPDRIKIVVVNALLNIIIGIAIALFMMSLDFTKHLFTSLKQVFFVGILLSALLTLPIFIKKWRKLRRKEDAGEFPDMDDPRNIKSFQLYFILLGIVLLVTGYTLFQLYSKLAGGLCFIAVLVLWVIEIVFIKHKDKNSNS